MIKTLWVVVVPLLLAACGLPPAVVVASYAVDGVSYIASGKSLADHGLSVLAQEDCAVWRVVVGRAICEEEDGIDIAETEGEGDEPRADLLSELKAQAPARYAQAQRPLPKAKPFLVASKPADGRYYLVIGSFVDRGNADRAAQQHAAYEPEIVSVVVKGKVFHRVIVGPFERSEVAALRARADEGPARPAFWINESARLPASDGPRLRQLAETE